MLCIHYIGKAGKTQGEVWPLTGGGHREYHRGKNWGDAAMKKRLLPLLLALGLVLSAFSGGK